MKNFKFLLIITSLITSTLFISSCSDDDSEEIIPTPTITIPTGTTLDPILPMRVERLGTSDGTGLSRFGLEWTEENNEEERAVITSNADKLVILESGDFESITTVEALQSAIENGTGVTEYTGVRTDRSLAYDDVIGVKNGDDYFLINITNAAFSTFAGSVTATIIGQFRRNPEL